MKNLGDQWVETIDGVEHMVKAVESVRDLPEMECGGCCFDVRDKCLRVDSCPGINLIVKDLGILRDGLLPCPFCGLYPTIHEYRFKNMHEDYLYYSIWHTCSDAQRVAHTRNNYRTKQECIDAWNRRV